MKKKIQNRFRSERCASQPPGNSLDDLGIEYAIDQSSLGHDYLRHYEFELSRVTLSESNIVIFSANNPVNTGKVFAEYYAESTVHIIWLGNSVINEFEIAENLHIHKFSSMRQIHNYLAGIGNICIIIDDGLNTKSFKLNYFREFFFHLRSGGMYISEDLHASHLPLRNDQEGEDIHCLLSRLISHDSLDKERQVSFTDEERYLSESINSVTSYGKVVFVRKLGNHSFKLPDVDANDILHARMAEQWGTVECEKMGGSFKPTTVLRSNRPKLDYLFIKEIRYPALNAREYNDVSCAPGQIVVKEPFILPDTYRQSSRDNLAHRRLKQVSHRFVNLSEELRHPHISLEGEYYFLDREWPAYGHVPTEVISRLWAWDEAKRKYPNLKVLVSAPDTKNILPSYEISILTAFGIATEDIVVLSEPARVKKLLAATPMFSISDYVNPKLTEIWTKIGDVLCDRDYLSAKRVFLSRRAGSLRECRNAEQLEDCFRQQNFTVIRPETLSLGQQVALIRNAEVIAGYAGSALLNLVFADGPKDVVVIGSDSFKNINEHLILGCLGGSLTYLFCEAEVKQPRGGWSDKAYHSDFSFNFKSDGNYLKETFDRINRLLP